MQVSISKAADMVGVTRATFYRHIDKKGISVEKDDDGNPKIDVSELIRVYGSKVKNPEEQEDLNSSDTTGIKQVKQSNTPNSIQVDLEVLKERVKHLEEDKQKTSEERERERELLLEQIKNLRESLTNSQEQQKRLTLLITDQREGQGAKESEQEKKLQSLEETISELRKQNKRVFQELHKQKNKSFWQRLFGS